MIVSSPDGDLAVLLTHQREAHTVMIASADGRPRTATALTGSGLRGLHVDRRGAILLTDTFRGRLELGASKLASVGESDTVVFALQP